MGVAVHDGVLALSAQPAGKDVTAGLEDESPSSRSRW
jgi:hypothetical protein